MTQANLPGIIPEQPKELAPKAGLNLEELGLEGSDILVPKILAMQGTSEMVANRKAAIGDLVNSVTGEKLGDDKTPFDIIPISKPFKTWVIFETKPGDKKPKFKEAIPYDAATKDLEQEETLADGTVIRRDRCLNFYVLLAKDVKNGEAFPYLIQCRRYSYSAAGKKLATHFTKALMVGAKGYSRALAFTVFQKEKDGNKWFVFDVGASRKTDADEVGAAENWTQLLASGVGVKHDDSDLAKPEESTPAGAEGGDF